MQWNDDGKCLTGILKASAGRHRSGIRTVLAKLIVILGGRGAGQQMSIAEIEAEFRATRVTVEDGRTTVHFGFA